MQTGFLNLEEEEILLYRVRDLSVKRSLGQRIFGVGSVLVHSSDKSMPHLVIKKRETPRGGKGEDPSAGGKNEGRAQNALGRADA